MDELGQLAKEWMKILPEIRVRVPNGTAVEKIFKNVIARGEEKNE